MGQTCRKQFPNNKAHAAGRFEIIHIAHPVGIHLGNQRHGRGKFVNILPVHDYPGGPCDGWQVDHMVG